MTKEELKRQIIEKEQVLETILPLSDGQECLIYKAKEFSVSDKIIYIPDVWENDLNTFDSSEDDVKSYAERVIESCYSGRDFVAECGGDVELAERLFHYCDWQHPSSALPEVDDRKTDVLTLPAKAHHAERQGGATMDTENIRQQLIDRVRDNFASYRAELLLKDRQELIDGADRIAKTAEVFQHFTEYRLTEAEMAYFLKFQNPLEVAADHWNSCTFELDALGAVIADAVDKEADLTLYPLAETVDRNEYDVVELFGTTALFFNERVPKDNVPEGLYCYDLRGSDYDPGFPVSVEHHVGVNHAGTILAAKPLEIPAQGHLKLDGELDFTGETMTINEFRDKYAPFEQVQAHQDQKRSSDQPSQTAQKSSIRWQLAAAKAAQAEKPAAQQPPKDREAR